jgi:dipeptidyl aminopeptidase/acylaminoacyl peptidase
LGCHRSHRCGGERNLFPATPIRRGTLIVSWYGIFDFSRVAAQNSSDSAAAKYLGCQPSRCDTSVMAAASPVTYIKRDSPPMLLIHGRADKTVSVEQSQEMYDGLQAAGVPAQLLLIPDVDHSFIGKTPASTPV